MRGVARRPVHGVGEARGRGRRLLGLGEHGRLLAEGDGADLDEAQQVGVGVSPLVQVGKVDLAAGVHVFADLDLHVRGRLDEGEGRVVGVGVQQGHGDGDVVGLALVGHGNGAHKMQQLPLPPVVEHELVQLGGEALVVVQQGEHVTLGEVGVSVGGLDAPQQPGQLGLG